MARLDLWFLLLAALCLACGVALGIVMGIAHDFSLAPVHAHLNLVGWASLALFGLTYRAFPEVKAMRRAALLHFAFSAPAAVLFPAGIWLAVTRDAPQLAIVAALLWFAGVLVFVSSLARAALAGRTREAAPGLAVAAE